MAATPSNASALFNSEYMKPWFSKAKAKAASGPLKAIASLFGDLGNSALSDSLFWGDEILEDDGWSGFIEELLYYTTHGDITNTTRLADALPWANSKTWLACHSMISPAIGSKYDHALLYLANQALVLHNGESYTYRVNSTAQLPAYIPAKFSIPLGAGATADAPLSYVADGALPASFTGEWTASYVFGAKKTRIDSPPYGQFGNFTSQVGRLPVHKAVAASSAAAAGVILVDALRDIAANVGANLGPRLAVWAAAAKSNPFEDADAILDPVAVENLQVNDEDLERIAGAGIIPLADGVYTDNSGIGHAVAAGATEVTAFVDSPCLLGLFSTSPGSEDEYSDRKLGGVVPAQYLPIFEFEDLKGFSSSQAYAQHLIDNFAADLAQPNETLEYATPISVGTIRCVTRANPWFAIPQGIPVTLNLIMGGTTLGVGAFTDLAKYGVTVESLVGSLSAAAQADSLAMNTLRGFFNTPTLTLRPPKMKIDTTGRPSGGAAGQRTTAKKRAPTS